MNWTLIVLLTVVGLMFIAVDFYIPGFVLGSIGAVLMLFATIICYRDTGSRNQTIMMFCVEVALGIGAGYASIWYFPRTTAGRRMILAEKQTGASAEAPRVNDWIGREGVAQTVLRPAGMALIDGKRLDVEAESGMIESGSPIKIVAVHKNRLVVKQLG
ncbi:MAG TPA: NfeD family protein [Verrucomicrobiae bacterium]|nr:NfeD family protein [Verrucomicrobiae bacterium]